MPAGRAGTVARVKRLPKGHVADQQTAAGNATEAVECLLRQVVDTEFPKLADALYEQQLLRSGVGPECLPTDDDLQSLQQATTVRLLGQLLSLLAKGRQLSSADCLLPTLVAAGRGKIKSSALTECDVEWGRLPVRCLGDVYETLAAHRLVVDHAAPRNPRQHGAPRHAFRLLPDKTGRRVRGMYYTPDAVVATIVEKTIRPVLDARNERLQPVMLAELLNIRVLDPAMGCGHFLVAAADFISRWLEESWSSRPASMVQSSIADSETLKCRVIEHCLHGVDLDPLAVELTIASLWLHAGGGLDLAALRTHLTCGDSLLNESGRGTFDAIVGNPPYGAMLDAGTARRLKRLLPQMRHNADTAVGFIERASTLLVDGGRCGLIVPKPLTYSFAWRRVRQFLHGRVMHLVDMSRVWSEVRLEQVILIFGQLASPAACTYDWSNGESVPQTMTMPKRIAERFDVWPCSLSRLDAKRLASLRLSDTTLGELCKTFRGLPAQRRLMPQGEIAVVGGRELERWRVRGVRGYLADDDTSQWDVFRRDKLLFQNIVAHIGLPQPHIRLIGAYDGSGLVTLDTVNNVVPRHDGVDLHGVLALLHSELINWFVYNVVYNRAIRTMHFDQYFLDKIPLPPDYEALLTRLAPLARTAAEPSESAAALEAINAAVDEAYLSS